MIVGTNYLPRVVRFVAWIQLLELPQLYEGGYITTCIAIQRKVVVACPYAKY